MKKVSKLSYQTLKSFVTGGMTSMGAVDATRVDWAEKENQSPTSEKAPFTITPIRGAEASLDDIALDFANDANISNERAMFLIAAIFEEVGEEMATGAATDVDCGMCKFALRISQSVLTANEEADPNRNVPYISGLASRQLLATAAQIETVSDASSQAFQIFEARGDNGDGTYLPLGKFERGKAALVFGDRFTMGNANEKIELVKDGNVYALTYNAVEDDLPTRIRTGSVPRTVPAGKGYQLRITAYGQGNVPSGPTPPGVVIHPAVVFKDNIEVLQGGLIPITITSAYAECDEDTITGRLNGENLKMLDGDTLNYSIDAGGMHSGAATVTESADGSIFFTISGATADWVGKTMTLTLNSRGGIAGEPTQTTVTTTEVEEA